MRGSSRFKSSTAPSLGDLSPRGAKEFQPLALINPPVAPWPHLSFPCTTMADQSPTWAISEAQRSSW